MTEGQRRLVALVFTDIVGYTKMAQSDEHRALELLDEHNSLIRSAIAKFGGREVKTMGDSFLIEFGSTLDAVSCAVGIQDAFHEASPGAAEAEVQVRVGVHVGDVLRRDGDVLGDAVNVASRVMGRAEGGQVLISDEVYAQVRNKLPYPMERMPGQRLKNVEVEMDLYRVVLPWERRFTPETPSPHNRLVVLPFSNISADPKDGYLADGITEELSSALSEVKELRIIARTTANRYKDTQKDAKQIGSELQVSHLLEGSVRRTGDKIRVTARLVDTSTQEDVWTARYDRDLEGAFTIQEDIVSSVMSSMKIRLPSEDKERITKSGTEDEAAYIAYLKGRALLREGGEEAVKAARQQFEKAVMEDPEYAEAYAGLADSNTILSDYLFAPVPVALKEARRCIDRALELDPDLGEARVSLGNLLMYDLRYREAQVEFVRGIRANPSFATGHHWYSICLASLGHGREGVEEALLAEELDPLSSPITLSVVYRLLPYGPDDQIMKRIRKLREMEPEGPWATEAEMAYTFARRDWAKALPLVQKMIEKDSADPYLDSDLAYIYAVTDRREDAIRLVEKLKVVPEGMRIKGQLLAFVCVGLGDLDGAFEWLDFALEQKEVFISWVREYPLFEPLRHDPRFTDLLRRAKVLAD